MPLAAGREGAGHRWWPRVIGFLAIFLTLQTAYNAGRSGVMDRLVIDTVTVRTAAALIDVLTPQVGVRAEGPRLRAAGGGLNVLNGCEGIDVAFLLVAAMLVAPLPWRQRWGGLLLGLPLVFALNQARVLALFYAYRSERVWFDWLHGALAPLVLVLAVGLFFLAWVGRSQTSLARPVPDGP